MHRDLRTFDGDFQVHVHMYEYNLSRKNIKKINLFIPLLFKDFVIFVRDSQISRVTDLPANYCAR